MGELVDMEGWALACAAKAFSKKLYIRKILTDFSPECDIHSNILSICRVLKKLEISGYKPCVPPFGAPLM